MKGRCFQLLIFHFLITLSFNFLFQMQISGKKCFLMTVFPHENLLLQIETPIIEERVTIMIRVNSQQAQIFQKQLMKSKDRITVDLDATPKPGKIQEIQTCLETSLDEKNDADKTKKYLVWMSHVGNFRHSIVKEEKNQISQKQQSQPQKKNIKQREKDLADNIISKANRIQNLYEQQIALHKKNEQKQRQNEQILQKIENKMYIISIFQTIVIIGITISYVLILNRMI